MPAGKLSFHMVVIPSVNPPGKIRVEVICAMVVADPIEIEKYRTKVLFKQRIEGVHNF